MILPSTSSGTVSDILVRTLIEQGVDHGFGIPGGPISAFFHAVLENPSLAWIQSKDENAAVFSAMGYFRVSRKLPLLFVTAGPGLMNAMNGLASAHLNRIPMIVIAGDVSHQGRGGRWLQDMGPNGLNADHMLEGMMRGVFRMEHARTARSTLSAALTVATDLRHPGPALILLPVDISTMLVPVGKVESLPAIGLPCPSRALMEQLLDLLASPGPSLVVIGNGCRRANAELLMELVEQLNIPFVTTTQAKGILNEEHPLSLRNGGLAASLWARKYTQRRIESTLVLGSDLDDCAVGATPYVYPGGHLIHVDLDSRVFNRNFSATLSLVSDIDSLAKELLGAARDRHFRRDEQDREFVDRLKAEPGTQIVESGNGVPPGMLVTSLQEKLPERTRFVSDIGEHMLFALHYLTITEESDFTLFLNHGSMGSGICGAIGIALADRRTPVVCFCGDGGLMMKGMELLLAVQHRLPILYAVFNDRRYNMVFHGMKKLYGVEIDGEQPELDFQAWGASLGLRSRTIHTVEELQDLPLETWLQEGPCLLDVRIDRDQVLEGAGRNERLQLMSQGSGGSA